MSFRTDLYVEMAKRWLSPGRPTDNGDRHPVQADGNGMEMISRLRVFSFRIADVVAGSRRINGMAVFRVDPRGKSNAMRPGLSEREQAPALHSAANSQSPAHFGLRRLDAALAPRELAATSERRSLLDCALSSSD